MPFLSDEILSRGLWSCLGRGFDSRLGSERGDRLSDRIGFDYQNESDETMLWVWLMGNWRKAIGSEIPYRSMLPLGLEGLLVACRAMSMTHDAHNQFRMQRDMQRIGEAAGLAAALTIRDEVSLRQVPMVELQQLLMESGALGAKSRARLDAIDEFDEPATTHLLPEEASTLAKWTEKLTGDNPREAMWALYRHGDTAVPTLIDTVQNGQPEQAFWSAIALSMMDRDEGATQLIQSLQERRDHSQEYIINAKGDRTKADKTAPTWYAVSVLLGRIGDKAAIPALIDALDEPDISLDGTLSIIRALGRIGEPTVIDAIERTLTRTDINTTRRLQNSTRVTADITDDARWQLDLGAAEVLAKLGLQRADLVATYLDDGRAYVRRYARKVVETVAA
ncbi:MAG: FAD-dependent oxidoreductase [Pseudomonadota bacterium]